MFAKTTPLHIVCMYLLKLLHGCSTLTGCTKASSIPLYILITNTLYPCSYGITLYHLLNNLASKIASCQGYALNCSTLDRMCLSQTSFSWSYSRADILCEHMFSTAWYSSSRLQRMDVLFWIASTDSFNFSHVCCWKFSGSLGFSEIQFNLLFNSFRVKVIRKQF